MLSSDKKISSQEFNTFFKKGIRSSSKNLSASLFFKEKEEKSKFAVVISKKTAKTAVLRHQNKRIIYNIIRQLYPQFENIKYCFFLIKRDIKNVDEKELSKEILSILEKNNH